LKAAAQKALSTINQHYQMAHGVVDGLRPFGGELANDDFFDDMGCFVTTGPSVVSRTSTHASFRSSAVAGRSTGRRPMGADALTGVSVAPE
jgi:hypothetical protein